MTNEEKKRLEKNLTKSGARAKTGYVRVKTGPLAESQGFSPLDTLPIHNPFSNKQTSLSTFFEEIKDFKDEFNVLRNTVTQLEVSLEDRRLEIEELNNELDNVNSRVRAIELFHLD